MNSSAGTGIDLFIAHQKSLVPSELYNAVDFLSKARNPTQGWGAYPGLPSDIHHTSLAVEALRSCCDNKYDVIILDAYIYLRDTYSSKLNDLDLEKLADLLSVVRTARTTSEDFSGRIRESMRRWHDANKNTENLSVRNQCFALISLLGLDHDKSETYFLQNWIKSISKLQSDDGGWPLVPKQPSSPLATSLAIRVLSGSNDGRFANGLERALSYLQTRIDIDGWENLGVGGDTFTQALVLRSLCESGKASYALVRAGVDTLMSRMNSDGGWGGGPKEPSNVESTALCLSALIAAGENCFVPTRLAQWVLGDVQSRLNDLTRQYNDLQQDFDQKVEAQCGRVAAECKRLTHEVDRLKHSGKKRLRASQGELNDKKVTRIVSPEIPDELLVQYDKLLQYDEKFLGVRSWHTAIGPRLVATSLIIIALISAMYWLYIWQAATHPPIPTVLLIASSVSVIAIILAILLNSYFPKLLTILVDRLSGTHPPSLRFEEATEKFARSVVKYDELSELRLEFSILSDGLRPSVREELLYRFTAELSDMPPDMGRRYIEETAGRFKLPRSQFLSLLKWVDKVMALNVEDRRVLFEQIWRVNMR